MTSKKIRRIKKYLNADTRKRLNYLYFCKSYIFANLDLALPLICEGKKK